MWPCERCADRLAGGGVPQPRRLVRTRSRRAVPSGRERHGHTPPVWPRGCATAGRSPRPTAALCCPRRPGTTRAAVRRERHRSRPGPYGPGRVASGRPSGVPQPRRLVLGPAVTMRVPSGENATAMTLPVWPSEGARSAAVRRIPQPHRLSIDAGSRRACRRARTPRPDDVRMALKGGEAGLPSCRIPQPQPCCPRSRSPRACRRARTPRPSRRLYGPGGWRAACRSARPTAAPSCPRSRSTRACRRARTPRQTLPYGPEGARAACRSARPTAAPFVPARGHDARAVGRERHGPTRRLYGPRGWRRACRSRVPQPRRLSSLAGHHARAVGRERHGHVRLASYGPSRVSRPNVHQHQSMNHPSSARRRRGRRMAPCPATASVPSTSPSVSPPRLARQARSPGAPVPYEPSPPPRAWPRHGRYLGPRRLPRLHPGHPRRPREHHRRRPHHRNRRPPRPPLLPLLLRLRAASACRSASSAAVRNPCAPSRNPARPPQEPPQHRPLRQAVRRRAVRLPHPRRLLDVVRSSSAFRSSRIHLSQRLPPLGLQRLVHHIHTLPAHHHQPRHRRIRVRRLPRIAPPESRASTRSASSPPPRRGQRLFPRCRLSCVLPAAPIFTQPEQQPPCLAPPAPSAATISSVLLASAPPTPPSFIRACVPASAPPAPPAPRTARAPPAVAARPATPRHRRRSDRQPRGPTSPRASPALRSPAGAPSRPIARR